MKKIEQSMDENIEQHKKNVIYNKIHLLLGEMEEDDSKKLENI